MIPDSSVTFVEYSDGDLFRRNEAMFQDYPEDLSRHDKNLKTNPDECSQTNTVTQHLFLCRDSLVCNKQSSQPTGPLEPQSWQNLRG